MGYKVLGFAVWQGGKWYIRRRLSGTKRAIVLAGLAVALAGGAVAISRRQPSA